MSWNSLRPLGGQAHAVGAAVALDVDAIDQPLGDQLVGDAGDVAAGDHHPARQLVHLQALGRALQLRHQVEAGQGGVEALAQLAAHLLFHQLGAGEQPQPQAQRVVVVAVRARFHVHGGLNSFGVQHLNSLGLNKRCQSWNAAASYKLGH
jgi:hypothetical protein